MQRITPVKLVSITSFQSESSCFDIGLSFRKIPATAHKTSICPKSFFIFTKASLTLPEFFRSVTIGTGFKFASHCSATRSMRHKSRASIITLKFIEDNFLTTAAPIPELAPVTIATLNSSIIQQL